MRRRPRRCRHGLGGFRERTSTPRRASCRRSGSRPVVDPRPSRPQRAASRSRGTRSPRARRPARRLARARRRIRAGAATAPFRGSAVAARRRRARRSAGLRGGGLAGTAAAWLVWPSRLPGHLVPTQLVLGLLAVLSCRRPSRTQGRHPGSRAKRSGAPWPCASRRVSARAAVVVLGAALAAVPCWLAVADGCSSPVGRPPPWPSTPARRRGARPGRVRAGRTRDDRLRAPRRASRLAPSPQAELALGNCLLRRGAVPGGRRLRAGRALESPQRRATATWPSLRASRRPAKRETPCERRRSLRPGDKNLRALFRWVRDATDVAGPSERRRAATAAR